MIAMLSTDEGLPMDMAESFSEGLREYEVVVSTAVYTEYLSDELPNYGFPLGHGRLSPGRGFVENNMLKMRNISADIVNGAREHDLQLSPDSGDHSSACHTMASGLPSSVVGVARDAVRIPRLDRVAQNSWKAELFDRALLRRTALVAAGENPEVAGYQPFIKPLYRAVAALFWPLVPLFLVLVATIVIRSPSNHDQNEAHRLCLSLVMVIDVLCRVSFYSIVHWILWDLPPRYMLGVNALTVVIVCDAFDSLAGARSRTACSDPGLMRLPASRVAPKKATIPARPA